MRYLKQTIIDKAVNEAKKSQHKMQIGAIIFNKKQIISTGYNFHGNRKKLHPKFTKYKYSIHAEVSAILSARKDLSGCDILVVRINKEGQLRMAKPCQKCRLYLDYVGIRKVYYSISEYPYIEKEE